MLDIKLRSASATPLSFNDVDGNFTTLADPLNKLADGTFDDAGPITGSEVVPLAGGKQTTTGGITAAAQDAADAALAAANAASDLFDSLANGTATDAGTLHDADISPMTRGAGLLQTTWGNVKAFIRGAIDNGTATDAGTLTGAETFPVSRGVGLLQTTLTKVATWLTGLWLNQRLFQWAYSTSFLLVSATRDANGAIVSASIVWPDGATGTFTTDTFSSAFPGAIDAWHASYFNASITKTVSQPAVTRDATGGVTAQPAITIA